MFFDIEIVKTDKSPATAGAKARVANDVSLREMMNDARLRRVKCCRFAASDIRPADE